MMNPKAMSDVELLKALVRVCCGTRQLLVRMLTYLGEVEDRMLYAPAAYPSMFEFCTRKLGMSEYEAYSRIAGARLVRRLPTLLPWLESGRIHLTTLVQLRDVWTADNVDELAAAVAGKSKLEVARELARRRPQPDVPDAIRRLPEPLPPGTAERSAVDSGDAEPAPSKQHVSVEQLGAHHAAAAAAGAARAESDSATSRLPSPNFPSERLADRGGVKPLSADRFKIQFTASEPVLRKIEEAQNMLRHRHPRGELETVFELALDALIARLKKERFAETDRPQSKERPASDEHIRAATRRDVVARDGVQCSYVSDEGVRCTSKAFLELDHATPRGKNGDSSVSNLRVYCRTHNAWAARQIYGAEFMQKVIAVRAHHRSARSSKALMRAVELASIQTNVTTAAASADDSTSHQPKTSEADFGQPKWTPASAPSVSPERGLSSGASVTSTGAGSGRQQPSGHSVSSSSSSSSSSSDAAGPNLLEPGSPSSASAPALGSSAPS